LSEHNAEFCLKLARGVCAVPVLFESGDKSTAHLLRDAGLFDAKMALSVDNVEYVLQTQASLIRVWLQRGGDQRISGGWGIEHDGKIYRVVNYGSGQAFEFPTAARATAEFLVRYVTFICDKWLSI
jgi:hypothetical protein